MMIRGRVDSRRQARVPLGIGGINGQFQTINVILDTGFNGSLTLPPEVVERLRLETDFQTNVILGNNVPARLSTWSGYILWHERPRLIQGLEAEGAPLLGMRLLQNSQLTIQVRVGGNVLIEELGGTDP